jgi:GNAT superfamily N-acetyltransferase
MHMLSTLSPPSSRLEAPFSLQQVSFRTHGDAIGRLRVQAWRNEQGIDHVFFARSSWVEELDSHSMHWVITDGEEVVAAARLSLHTSLADVPYAYLLAPTVQLPLAKHLVASLSRMVVAPHYRGHRFSKMLDQVRVAAALAAGATALTGATQLTFRQQALTNLGFCTLCELRNAPERPEWPLYFMVYYASANRPTVAPPRSL